MLPVKDTVIVITTGTQSKKILRERSFMQGHFEDISIQYQMCQ